MDADSVSSKKRCGREERIAEVQLKAYWELYPLPTCERQAEHTHTRTPAPDSDDDEVIEDRNQKIEVTHETGNHSESEQELIDEVQSNIQQHAIADHLRNSIKKGSSQQCQAKALEDIAL